MVLMMTLLLVPRSLMFPKSSKCSVHLINNRYLWLTCDASEQDRLETCAQDRARPEKAIPLKCIGDWSTEKGKSRIGHPNFPQTNK